MRFSRPGNGTILGGLALFVALGGTALAATGTLVNIADGTDASRVAHVDAKGKLYVGDGVGAMTVDGNVTSQPAAPATLWRASAGVSGSCAVVATPPSGKALILRSLTINLYSAPSFGADQYIVLYNTSNCAGPPIWDMTPTQLGATMVDFDAGVAIPSSGGLSASDYNGAGFGFEVYAKGYTVAASVVPASAAPEGPPQAHGSGPPADQP